MCSVLPIVNSVPAVPPADDFASLFDGAVTTTAIVAAAATTVVVVIFFTRGNQNIISFGRSFFSFRFVWFFLLNVHSLLEVLLKDNICSKYKLAHKEANNKKVGEN